MKTMKTTFALVLSAVLWGCKDNPAVEKKSTVSDSPSVQAEAARKEMDTLPKAFETPDYFKKNEPTPTKKHDGTSGN